MGITRRNALAGMGALLVMPALALAADPVAVSVVKIMSFSCGHCYSAEAHDRAIALAAERTGGRFVRGPIPSVEEDTGAMARLYYAARDMNGELGERVKSSLYKGAQDAEVPLFNFMQIYAWISQDLSADEASFETLFKRAQGPETQQALGRAFQLVSNAGVQFLPTYILLTNNTIKAVLDTNASSGGTVSTLRNTVVAKIEQLNKPNGNSTTS